MILPPISAPWLSFHFPFASSAQAIRILNRSTRRGAIGGISELLHWPVSHFLTGKNFDRIIFDRIIFETDHWPITHFFSAEELGRIMDSRIIFEE